MYKMTVELTEIIQQHWHWHLSFCMVRW